MLRHYLSLPLPVMNVYINYGALHMLPIVPFASTGVTPFYYSWEPRILGNSVAHSRIPTNEKHPGMDILDA